MWLRRRPDLLGLCFFATVCAVSIEAAEMRRHEPVPGVSIEIPAGWETVSGEKLNRAAEFRVDGPRAGSLTPGSAKTDLGFLAGQLTDRGAAQLSISVLPSDASQSEVRSWSDELVELLGRELARSEQRKLEAAGASDFELTSSSRADFGNRVAVAVSTRYLLPDGDHYRSDRYYVYTARRTVAIAVQYDERRADELVRIRNRMLATIAVD